MQSHGGRRGLTQHELERTVRVHRLEGLDRALLLGGAGRHREDRKNQGRCKCQRGESAGADEVHGRARFEWRIVPLCASGRFGSADMRRAALRRGRTASGRDGRCRCADQDA